jgi:GNAT superfamily N-acetyltransferase
MVIHSNKELAFKLETIEARNQVEYATALNRLDPNASASYKKIGSGYAVYAGQDSPLTQAFGLGLDGPASEEDITELESFFDQRGAAVNVEVCNLADLSLPRLLVSRGYQIIECSNVLLRKLSEDCRAATGSAITICEIDADEADLFAGTVARGFLETDEPPESFVDIFKVFFSQSNCACFGAFVDGEPAGGGAVFITEDVAELGGASTLPKHRNKGIQTGLLRARMGFAKSRGCELAMVTTLPGSISQRNVEKQGFHIAYSRTKFTNQR